MNCFPPGCIDGTESRDHGGDDDDDDDSVS